MRLALAALAMLLAGCQNTPANEQLIEMAQRDAFLPDCASLRVVHARQLRDLGPPELVVSFAASGSCMTEWANRLDSSPWKSEHHGGWSSPDDEIFATRYGDDPYRGMVAWWHAEPVPGVPDHSEELSR